MKHKNHNTFFLFLLMGILSIGASDGYAQEKKPNIIFIFTDDLGYGDIGVLYQNLRKKKADKSEPWAATPNLDIMANEGAILTQHYAAAPVCAPSRASLLTGLSQGHANVRNNQFDKALADGGFDFESFSSRFNQAATKIKLPVLVVRGEESLLSSPETLQSLANTIPNAETEEIAGAGHYVAFDNEEFNAVLLAFLERRIPREPPEYVTGSDSRTLRDAMGCFASGITVVTTKDENGNPVGLTANSFTSVSLDPPLVLVCLGKNVGSLPAFNGAESFAVNILHTGQQPISNLFASKGKDRFKETDWQTWDKDVPIINNSLANFECIKTAEIEQGDHILFVGEVVRARFDPRRDPLLYSSSKYRRLHFD